MTLNNAVSLFSEGIGIGVILAFWPEMIIFAIHKVYGLYNLIK